MDQNESLTLTAEAELTKDQAMPDSDEKMEENQPLTADDEHHKDKAMSDSDDSDSEDEAQQNLLLESLQTELAANPSNYDGHLQSISLWCDYINFVQEFDPMVRQCTPTGISKARDLFESALTAAGLHVAEGSKIWEAYRQYEQAILLTTDDTDAQAKEKQVHRIRSLFHRQLSVPLADMSSTLTAYKAWEAEQRNLQDVETIELVDIYPHVASSYQKALEMYNARFHLEEQIFSLNVGNIVSNVYSRATKNCPWVGELWIRYMLSLERGHTSEKDLSEVCSG
ncbi:hypothetical protein V8G54_025135 [Vigna mungo]|uniref:Suppressor of forked domain-containing protein n=1 Tax=Vigna mungo TaxID=3915 RepID=A0AAQ3RQR6_VIGMU